MGFKGIKAVRTGMISLRSIGPFHPEVTLTNENKNAAAAAFDVF
jgi:hypothetical protein